MAPLLSWPALIRVALVPCMTEIVSEPCSVKTALRGENSEMRVELAWNIWKLIRLHKRPFNIFLFYFNFKILERFIFLDCPGVSLCLWLSLSPIHLGSRILGPSHLSWLWTFFWMLSSQLRAASRNRLLILHSHITWISFLSEKGMAITFHWVLDNIVSVNRD